MKQGFLILMSFLVIYSAGMAQEVAWQKTIGTPLLDNLNSMTPTFDGGYLCAGNTAAGISGDKTVINHGSNDIWLVKLDKDGNILWQKGLGGTGNDLLYSIQQTADSGFICGASSDSPISGDKTEGNLGSFDYWIIKLDVGGNIQWQNVIGGSSYDNCKLVKQAFDGSYFCGGTSNSTISGDKTEIHLGVGDYWILKLDALGNVLWDNTLGGTDRDDLTSLLPTLDGGCISGGWSESDISGDKLENSNGFQDLWIIKLDALGNEVWQNTIGGTGADYLYVMQQTTGGDFICGSTSYSGVGGDKTVPFQGQGDWWFIKIDSLGNIISQFSIGGSNTETLRSIEPTQDGGFICGGDSKSPISGFKTEKNVGDYDYWVVKLDSLGNIMWQNNIGGLGIDNGMSTFEINGEGVICAGQSISGIGGEKVEACRGNYDFWIVKLTSSFNLIQGNVFMDLNSDLLHDVSEPAGALIRVTEINSNRIAFSNLSGQYSLSVLDSGQFQVSPTSFVPYYSANPTVHSSSFSGILQIDSLNDFAFQPIGPIDDLCMTISPLGQFRPGFNGIYRLNYTNEGTTTQNPTIVFRLFPNISFVSSSIPPNAVYPDSVVWNLPPLGPFQSGELVTIQLSPTIPIGTILNSYAQIFPVANDPTPSCNNATWEVTVTGSFDPNDILVDKNKIVSTLFPNPPYLDYIIRFQNTGTDTAFTVKILNPIDTAKLDINSMDFVAATHPVEMRFLYHENNFEFKFNNILLPDSNVNEPESHAFVRYKIKPKSTLNAGDTVLNKAGIYFDFNEAVFTNIAKTFIVLPTGMFSYEKNSEVLVFPNPTTSEINIKISNTEGKRISLDVYNLFGQKVKSLFDGKIMSSELKQQFDISSLNQGVYLLQYNVDGVTKSRKIIKF
jgi:Secretion system C-terminal sorting domain